MDFPDDQESEEEVKLTPREQLKQQGLGLINAILKYNSPQQEGTGKDGKPKKTKYRERKYIVVLDDLSTELKSKSLVSLLKNHRHFEMAVLISSQYYLDISGTKRNVVNSNGSTRSLMRRKHSY